MHPKIQIPAGYRELHVGETIRFSDESVVFRASRFTPRQDDPAASLYIGQAYNPATPGRRTMSFTHSLTIRKIETHYTVPPAGWAFTYDPVTEWDATRLHLDLSPPAPRKPITVTLSLTSLEAEALLDLCRCVGGCPRNSPRAVTDRITEQLYGLGLPEHENGDSPLWRFNSDNVYALDYPRT